jgi:alanine racemase
VSASIEIDLDALARNYARLRTAVGGSRCAAVVKADAYGLGLAPVARRLAAEGCTEFFVATLGEGQALRALLPGVQIYVFEGPASSAVEPFAAHDLVPVLNSLAQIASWSGSGLPAALHVDTGMNRLGLEAGEVAAIAADSGLLQGLKPVFVMTHLACADRPEHLLNRAQLEAFSALRAKLPSAPTSIGNSAGSLLGPEFRGDLVRPGIALYGGNPFTDRVSPVEPVVTVTAPILQIRRIETHGTVGYGASFPVAPGMRIAVIAYGYADGLLRALGNAGSVAIDGRLAPIVGRVSMDLICVDVSLLPKDETLVGARAQLLGHDVLIDDAARAAGTISYELLTALGSRAERSYLESERTDD